MDFQSYNLIMTEIIRFTIRLSMFSALVFLLFFWIEPEIPPAFQYHNWLYIQLFFMLLTFLFHLGLLHASNKRAQSVTLFYMGGTSLKLLLFAGIMITYAMLFKQTAKAFIITFIFYYFLYTIFEVAMLYFKFSSSKGPSET